MKGILPGFKDRGTLPKNTFCSKNIQLMILLLDVNVRKINIRTHFSMWTLSHGWKCWCPIQLMFELVWQYLGCISGFIPSAAVIKALVKLISGSYHHCNWTDWTLDKERYTQYTIKSLQWIVSHSIKNPSVWTVFTVFHWLLSEITVDN